MRYTPEIIDDLKPKEVFVFGSNESGIHGAGAARVAWEKFGAVYGVGFGMTGQTFAIPTKDWNIQTLDFDVVAFYVARFIEFAANNPKKTFLVTKIGCGLAGFTIEEIAPLFTAAAELPNVVLPKEFVEIIEARA